MGNNDFTNLGNILNQIAENFDLKNQLLQANLENVWKDIVTEYGASVCKIKKFENGELYLTTHSSTWKMEFQARKETFINRIKDQTGITVVDMYISVE